jgi:hypothetical protein
VEDVDLVVTDRRTVEEVVLRLDGDDGRVELPVAIVADRSEDAHLVELRVYFSTWPRTGGHAIRPPLLQPDPDVREADVVGEYQRALAAGDVEAAVATFEPDGYVREPAGGVYVHRGSEELRALYELFFANGGGIPLEHCTATDDGRACALEYNVVRWGRTELPPEAGVAVYVRGATGKLAGARIYDRQASAPMRVAGCRRTVTCQMAGRRRAPPRRNRRRRRTRARQATSGRRSAELDCFAPRTTRRSCAVGLRTPGSGSPPAGYVGAASWLETEQ